VFKNVKTRQYDAMRSCYSAQLYEKEDFISNQEKRKTKDAVEHHHGRKEMNLGRLLRRTAMIIEWKRSVQ